MPSAENGPPPSESAAGGGTVYQRSSSFTRSFYKPDDDPIDLIDEDAKIAAEAAAAAAAKSPTKQSPRERRMSSRRMSRRSFAPRISGGSGGGPPSRPGSDAMSRAAAAAAAAFDEGKEYDDDKNNNGDVPDSDFPPPPSSKGRQASWYQDALQAGAGIGDLSAILGSSAADLGAGSVSATAAPASSGATSLPTTPLEDGAPNTENDEVLEQYRIMAHLDALQRVKENTGFDAADYEKRRKAENDESSRRKVEYFTGKDKPKVMVPEVKPLSTVIAEDVLYQPQEPPQLGSTSSLSRTKRLTTGLLVDQRSALQLPSRHSRSPGLVKAVLLRGSTQSIPDHEQAVRCFGCNSLLRVNLLAASLLCPECQTVCPVSSTRR